MIISTFKSVQKAYVDLRLDLSWDEIVELLTYHYDVNSKTDVELYNMVDFKITDYELGRKYHYVNGERQDTYDEIPNTVRRCKNNLVSISGIVLDYDKDQTIEDTIRELDGIEYVLYTTFRHTIDNHRFRVVIPFSQPLLASDVRGRQNDIKKMFPSVDNASFSVSQSFYFHSGKQDSIAYHNKGIIIDPYDFIVEEFLEHTYTGTYQNTNEEITHLIQELKRCYPQLEYDEWIRVTWAFCHELGEAEGINLMRQYYPESAKNEYSNLTKSIYTGKKVTLGTIVKMIRDAGGKILQKRVVKEIEYQDRLNEIKMLTEILQRKKNGTK
jgi:hypothetical protein